MYGPPEFFQRRARGRANDDANRARDRPDSGEYPSFLFVNDAETPQNESEVIPEKKSEKKQIEIVTPREVKIEPQRIQPKYFSKGNCRVYYFFLASG
jgi:hypothetical protein